MIYSKLKSANVMSGKSKGNMFSVEFVPDKKNRINDDQFDALMSEEDSTLKYLLNCGDFVEDAESASAEISNLKGELKKLGLKLKAAEDAAEHAEKEEIGVGVAEDALIKAEDALGAATNAESKKEALKEVNKAKKNLGLAKKEAKKAAKDS